MAIKSDFLGDPVTIDDDLLGSQIVQADLDAADEYLYSLARRLGVAVADIVLPATKFAIIDLGVAVACQRRAGLKAGRQPFGEDDPYMQKQKYYATRMTQLTGEVQVYEFTGVETSDDAYAPVTIGLVRG